VEYGLASAYSVQALRVSQYARYNFFVCGPKFITSPVKFGKDIPTSMEVIEAQTLNFKPNFKFSRSKLGGGVPVGVCARRPWSISNALRNLREQHHLMAEM